MTNFKAKMRLWEGMNVLVLSPTPTHPIDFGNRRRIYFLCRRIRSLGAQIHFVHYPSEHDWRSSIPAHEQEMAAEWDSYYLIPPTRGLHSPPSTSYHTIDEWWDESIGTFIQYISRMKSIDAFIVNYTWLSKALEFVPDTVFKILDTHDKFSGRREILELHGIAPEFFYTSSSEESKAFSRADVVWAIKQEEAAIFEQMTRSRVLTMLHAEPLSLASAHAHGSILKFGIAGARNSINAANFRDFLVKLDLYVRRTLLPLEIVIAGTCCDLLPDIHYPYVKMLGRVESMDEFYDQVDVALIPMSFSTGLKIKVGEALGRRMAVISHAHAFEGYVPKHPMHSCQSFDDMISSIRDVIVNPTIIEDLQEASAASLLAAERHVAKSLYDTIYQLYEPPAAVYIAIPCDEIGYPSLAVDHAIEAAEYIKHQSPVAFVITGSVTIPPNSTVTDRLRKFGRIVCTPQVWSEFGKQSKKFFGTSAIPVLPLSSVLKSYATAVWFAGYPDLSEMKTIKSSVPAYVHLGLIHLQSATVEFSEVTSYFCKSFSSLTFMDSFNSRLYQQAVLHPTTRLLTCPMLWRGHMSAALNHLLTSAPNPIVVLTNSAKPRVEKLIVDAVHQYSGRELIVVKSITDQLWPEDAARSDLLTDKKFIEILARGNTRPYLVIDASDDSGFHALKELCLRAFIPTIKVFSDGPFLPKTGKLELGEWAVGTYQSLDLIRRALADHEALKDLELQMRNSYSFNRDAGWNIIWSDISQLISQ